MMENKKCEHFACNRDAWANDEHCIFHSKDIEGKKKVFKYRFWKEFERQKKKEKEYNFVGFIFPDFISFKKRSFRPSMRIR